MKIYYDPNGEMEKEKAAAEEHSLTGGTMMEETLGQHAKMKGKPFKEQFKYYFGYYKFHALGILVGIAIIVSIITTIASHKDDCFVAMIVNSININSEVLSEGFGHYAGMDLDKYECFITANETELLSGTGTAELSASTKFAAYLSTQDLDIAIFDSDVYYRKAMNGCFHDLRDVLSPEDIARYKDSFFYIDQVEYDRLQENEDPMANLFPDIERGTYEDQAKRLAPYMDPSSMKDPVPVGIVVYDSPGIQGMRCYSDMIPVLGIPANTKRIDAAITFIHFLYDENVDFSPFQMYNF